MSPISCVDGSHPDCGCRGNPEKCCITYYRGEADKIIRFFKKYVINK